ncbi:Lysine decarboxylase, constitutive [compost metagenome]
MGLVTPYPPGIPLLIPGEVFNRKIVDYLIFAREFSKLCPGFETDIHGLVELVDDKGEVRYYADCVALDAGDQAVQTQVISAPVAAGKKTSPMLAGRAPAKSGKIKTEAAMKKALKAEKPVGDASVGKISPVEKTPQAVAKSTRTAKAPKPRTPKA